MILFAPCAPWDRPAASGVASRPVPTESASGWRRPGFGGAGFGGAGRGWAGRGWAGRGWAGRATRLGRPERHGGHVAHAGHDHRAARGEAGNREPAQAAESPRPCHVDGYPPGRSAWSPGLADDALQRGRTKPEGALARPVRGQGDLDAAGYRDDLRSRRHVDGDPLPGRSCPPGRVPGATKATRWLGTTVSPDGEVRPGTSSSVTREPARAAATSQPAVRPVAAAATCPARGRMRDRGAAGPGGSPLPPGVVVSGPGEVGSWLADGECSFTEDTLICRLRHVPLCCSGRLSCCAGRRGSKDARWG